MNRQRLFMAKMAIFVSLALAMNYLLISNAYAFRDDFRGERRDNYHRRDFHRENYSRDRDVNQRRDARYHQAEPLHNLPASERNSLAQVHQEKAPKFSQQHFTMSPHQGIPTNSNTNWNNNWNNHAWNNNWNTNWNNNHWGSWNNNWNNNWNHNWSGWNTWDGWNTWSGWNTGFLSGALLSTALTASLFSYSNVIYPYPYLINNTLTVTNPVPAPANNTSNTFLPSNEIWLSAKNGDVPKSAVINNTENGKSTYYCRVTYLNKLAYGVLVPQDGCYVEDSSATTRFTDYDVLITK